MTDSAAVASTPPCLLSIILVSYNSLSDFQRCLPSIESQRVTFFYELILVDNHHQDGVAEWITQTYPSVRLISNPANTGYAGGNNVGLQYAHGQWVLFLNPDTVLHSGCLEQLLVTAKAHPTAFINPKLLNPDGTINACGNQMHYTGITSCRGLNEPAERYEQLEFVPLLSGAALLAPTQAVRELGGFDESFFMYFEDADLSLRARLRGYTLLCEERSVITHYYTLGMSAQKFYYLERNRLITFVKLFPRSILIRLLPAIMLTEGLTWGFALRSFNYLKQRFRVYAWLWKHWKTIKNQHVSINSNRHIPPSALLADTTTTLPFEQLIGGGLGKLLNRILGPVYRVLKPTG